jgi:hypothetical protein
MWRLFRIASGKTLAVQRGLVCSFLPFAQLGAVGEADPQGGISDGVDSRTAYVTETKFAGYLGVADGDSVCHRVSYAIGWIGFAIPPVGGGASTLMVTTTTATTTTTRHANDLSKSLCDGANSSCIRRSHARRSFPAESRMEFMRSPVPTQMRQDER